MKNGEWEMGNETGMVVPVTEEYHVAQARLAAKALANSLGLSEVGVYSIATAVSELANNLFFHTSRGGTISLSVVRQNGNVGLEIIAEDEGPGIADVDLALTPGYSTAPDWVRELGFGAGMGLCNIKECADEMNLDSTVGAGTRLEARIQSEVASQ